MPHGRKVTVCVTQSRLLWTSSRVHLKGYSNQSRNYLKAAEQGYRFLMEHFLDRKNGGYFWTTDPTGKVLNDRKILYGESFVLYALVEYYRASGDKESLRRAIDLYHDVQKHAHDAKNGGWFEHFTRDWTPIMKPDPDAIVEVAGYKSANTHLHLMEALTELYEVTLDDEIKRSLEECLRLNATYLYPKDAGKSCFHRQPDWKEVTDPKSAGLSYGHNVEFAWLMIRAQKVLGAPPAWDHLDRKSTRLNSSHGYISYAVFCLKKKKETAPPHKTTTSSSHQLGSPERRPRPSSSGRSARYARGVRVRHICSCCCRVARRHVALT